MNAAADTAAEGELSLSFLKKYIAYCRSRYRLLLPPLAPTFILLACYFCYFCYFCSCYPTASLGAALVSLPKPLKSSRTGMC